MLSRNLEKSLHRALSQANDRHHEYATLEHLLMALTEDQDAIAVLKACGVDIEKLSDDLKGYLDEDLSNLVVEDARKSPARTCWWPCSPSAKATRCTISRNRTCPVSTP